jgi:N-acetylmuramoyl-L-alanine amidase
MKSRSVAWRLAFALPCLLAFLLAAAPARSAQKDFTLGFDLLADLAGNVDAHGVKFSGATVLACGASLNCGPFPPASGKNVIYDSGRSITSTFEPSVGVVSRVSAKITGNTNITMTALDRDGRVIGSRQTGGPNYVGSGGPAANMLLSIESPDVSIKTVTFHDSGNTFTIDDFTFRAAPVVFLIDPGHGLIKDSSGMSRFQRPASPLYSLREDLLTLDIGKAALAKLRMADLEAYSTRTTAAALYDQPCGQYDAATDSIPLECAPDTRLRAAFVDTYEVKGSAVMLVSIHTNGGGIPGQRKKGRTQTYSCEGRNQPLGLLVLEKVKTVVPPVISLTSGGFDGCVLHVLKEASGANTWATLVEALYHNVDADEEILVNGPKRAAIGEAIADALIEFAKTRP